MCAHAPVSFEIRKGSNDVSSLHLTVGDSTTRLYAKHLVHRTSASPHNHPKR